LHWVLYEKLHCTKSYEQDETFCGYGWSDIALVFLRMGPSRCQHSCAASSDWSVSSAHSLASNPPLTDVVQGFVNCAFGGDGGHVCQFRFADLRHSGNLSLITVIDAGGKGGCNGIDIFDKTGSGFEHYSNNANSEDNLSDSILDINHDGNPKLVLYGSLVYGPLTSAPSRLIGCDAEWPMLFAWTGKGYSE
jgi:hypothetical protein